MKKIKLILTTICCLVGLGSFCSAGAILYGEMRADETRTNTSYVSWDLGDGGCFWKHVAGGTIYWKVDGTEYSTTHGAWVYCGTGTVDVKTSSSSYGYKIFTGIKLVGPQGCPSCPSQYTSLECQSEYSLIPVSSVDSTYCENNNLCSSSSVECSSGDYSSIYINGVQHDPAPVIDIQISDEIDWDYAYSGSGSQFNLDIVGYNVDYEKMEEVLLVQNYVPSSEDFTNLISSLVPYMKILVFVLFAYIVIKRLKKPFSSKFK